MWWETLRLTHRGVHPPGWDSLDLEGLRILWPVSLFVVSMNHTFMGRWEMFNRSFEMAYVTSFSEPGNFVIKCPCGPTWSHCTLFSAHLPVSQTAKFGAQAAKTALTWTLSLLALPKPLSVWWCARRTHGTQWKLQHSQLWCVTGKGDRLKSARRDTGRVGASFLVSSAPNRWTVSSPLHWCVALCMEYCQQGCSPKWFFCFIIWTWLISHVVKLIL